VIGGEKGRIFEEGKVWFRCEVPHPGSDTSGKKEKKGRKR